MGLASSYTSACVAAGEYTRSYSNTCLSEDQVG